MADALIQTHELSKVFLDFWRRPRATAVDRLTLTVHRGEIFGLLGPNGSGKSTTIKLILGLLFPTNGHVAVFGKPPTDVAAKKRIGFLPEESYLYRYLDAEETLDFYARLFRLPAHERARRIEALLRLTGLAGARKRLLGEYSKGMARRIGIAQALINDPELVILDEPTTGLDPIGTREVKDLILQLKAKGKTVLLSSHLLADVEDVCDRIAILYGGRLQTEGRTEELLRQESLVQVTAPMDAATVEAVGALIRQRAGSQTPVTVSPPVERLEQFFLRVVEAAQQRRETTSGVGAAGGALDFLTREAPAAPEASPLERLTRPAEPAAPAAQRIAEKAPEKSPAPSLLLRDLAAPAPPPPPEKAEKKEAPPPPAAETGRSVLDRLIRQEDDPEGDGR